LAGRGEEAVIELREALLENSEPGVCFQLSRALAFYYGRLPEPRLEKFLFYSRLAVDYAERWGDTTARVCAYQSLGLAIAAGSGFEAASDLFQGALALAGREPTPERGAILGSLGYCRASSGSMSDGVMLLSRSIRIARTQGAPIYETAPRVFLASCLLDLRRPEDAERHLRIALQINQAIGQTLDSRAAMYLLGDALKMSHKYFQAHDTFLELQTRFYPQQEGLAEILMGVDARRMVNLLL
jgi:tetratricopeptide (TPR) repeat protein